MCGRFSIGVDTDALIEEFGIATLAGEHEPRFNVAPTQDVPAVVRSPDGLRMGLLRWGLIPAWAREPGGAPLINARSETVDRKPSFRDPFRSRRCWILADGFYEWRREPGGGKTPIYIRRPDGAPFAFAGLWDRWEGPGGPIASAVILTTEATDSLRPIHERMPVILPRESRATWLDPDVDPGSLGGLLGPYPGELEAYPVSDRVNSPDNDDPACRRPA